MLCWKGVEFSLLLIFSAGDKFSGQLQSRSPGGAPRWVWGLGMELEVFSTFDVFNCIFLQWKEEHL